MDIIIIGLIAIGGIPTLIYFGIPSWKDDFKKEDDDE